MVVKSPFRVLSHLDPAEVLQGAPGCEDPQAGARPLSRCRCRGPSSRLSTPGETLESQKTLEKSEKKKHSDVQGLQWLASINFLTVYIEIYI